MAAVGVDVFVAATVAMVVAAAVFIIPDSHILFNFSLVRKGVTTINRGGPVFRNQIGEW